MRKLGLIISIIMVISLMGCATTTVQDQYAYTIAVFKRSDQVKPYFQNAYGYAVFPTIGKGAVVIGGAFGKGQVYRQGVAAGSSALVKMSIGLQMGGQAFSEVIFFQDERSYNEFTRGGFEFDASASAVVVTVGAQAQAGTRGVTAGASAGPSTGAQADTSYTKGVAVFLHTKGGFMYEAAIGGQRFTFQPY